jgi:hypothetical protein
MVDVRPLSQMDPRWKDKPLGASSMTIGKYGCLMTSMTMVANSLGFDLTPDTVNEKMKAVSGFQGALIIPALFPKAVPGMLYNSYIQCRDQPAPLAEIDASLAAGKPVIVEVNYAPDAGLQNHWIVLYEKRGSDYLIRDPYPFPADTKELPLLTSRYKFAGSAAKIIQGVVFLSSARAAAPPPAKVSLDKGVKASFPVFATADGLALRSQTVVADQTLIKRAPLGTRLTVLESDAAAKSKIGVLNQWLAVKDPADGCEGYTAAWYVSTEQPVKPAGLTSAQPAPAQPTHLIVKTIEEGVALRSKPEISDASLLKRVPVNTELRCTDPFQQALAQVGVVYQWLKVQDVTGSPAVVAAWYVTPVNGQSTLGVKDQGSGLSFGLDSGEIEPTIVRAAVEGLALRSLPLITPETLIKRLPIHGELIVLEPPEICEPKIGRMGDWLHVRDVDGCEGYVAAWYAVRRPDLAIQPGEPLPG